MKNKEEVLALLGKEYVSIASLNNALEIQHYQCKMILEELINEGLVESTQIGKRIVYRAKPLGSTGTPLQ